MAARRMLQFLGSPVTTINVIPPAASDLKTAPVPAALVVSTVLSNVSEWDAPDTSDLKSAHASRALTEKEKPVYEQFLKAYETERKNHLESWIRAKVLIGIPEQEATDLVYHELKVGVLHLRDPTVSNFIDHYLPTASASNAFDWFFK